MIEKIVIRGAREHNLKNVSLDLPRDKFIVMTGVSGSGKSSLAFDTIYADGQRRYMESLSSYARQFLGLAEKPDCDLIEGLSPAISIDQKTTSRNPRSTVGTVTEVYDYLRLLYARIGVPHCPVCGREIRRQTPDMIADQISELPEKTRFMLLAPVISGKKGEHVSVIEKARKGGYVRVRVDGIYYELTEEIKLEKNKKHSIEIVIDRLAVKGDIRSRLTQSIETAAALSDGLILIDILENDAHKAEELLFSLSYACPEHGISVPELQPRMFSFNNPFGACETCTGLGVLVRIDADAIVPDKSVSIRDGAIKAMGWNTLNPDSFAMIYYRGVAKVYKISLDTPFGKLPKSVQDVFLYGSKGTKLEFEKLPEWGGGYFYREFEGVIPNLERKLAGSTSETVKEEINGLMKSENCPDCHGERLKPVSRAVTVGERNITEVTKMSVTAAAEFIGNLKLSDRDRYIADKITKEIVARLAFLRNVGLEYLTLSRAAATLSGGEAQRIRLATQIGSALVGVLYVLDEPSIGLHQRDNGRLIEALKHLRDAGNTLIVVEHDEDTMYAADYIVDIGPKAGIHGGEIVATGTIDDIKACEKSITGQYLSGVKSIPVPKTRREYIETITFTDCSQNNLKNIDISIPIGVMTCVTGVSGSGKSSLVNEIIYKYLRRNLNRARETAGAFGKCIGIENLDKVIDIDQSPIGRTPRSNPATYTGVWNDIREIFAATNDAKVRGYGPGRFSFNVKGGRCEACEGDGIVKIEMHFLPDVYVPCESCGGKRYNRETLEVHYKGKSIADVLDMTVDEAVIFFEHVPKILRKISTLREVGLGYIKLGQPATTLSGGEAQRVKLATELSKRATGKTMYILDEPTTGLHTADVHRLSDVLSRLTDAGNTVLVIEHNLDVIKTADWIIDLGPDGGDGGGEIIAEGTPEQVAKSKKSYTAAFLKKALKKK
ncbi:MAG: excinuclease ABC subunit UvrA [Ruminococcus sp.]|jgi:excinuclease ABC subunit A|nr:excinuclease ABC subunit UvrA [Ruminococcus sp.]